MRAEPEALDRQRAEAKVAALLVQLRPAEDVDALAVGEVESERIEAPTRHRRGQAGAVRRVLEREEDGRPALVPAQLRDLALHPDGRQPREPACDAAVETRDRIDLAITVFGGFDLHGTSMPMFE